MLLKFVIKQSEPAFTQTMGLGLVMPNPLARLIIVR